MNHIKLLCTFVLIVFGRYNIGFAQNNFLLHITEKTRNYNTASFYNMMDTCRLSDSTEIIFGLGCQDLANAVKKCPHLVGLDLKGNCSMPQIDSILSALSDTRFTAFSILNLGILDGDSCPVNLSELNGLTWLEFTVSSDKGFVINLEKFSNLETLIIHHSSENSGTAIHTDITHLSDCRKLKELFIDNVSIQTYKNIMKVDRLSTLVIRYSSLPRIDNRISSLRNVQKISFINCGIKRVSVKIRACQGLVELALQRNRLRKIPKGIKFLKNLETLRLDENKIRTIPKWIFASNINYLNTNTYLNYGIRKIPKHMQYVKGQFTFVCTLSSDFNPDSKLNIFRLRKIPKEVLFVIYTSEKSEERISSYFKKLP